MEGEAATVETGAGESGWFDITISADGEISVGGTTVDRISVGGICMGARGSVADEPQAFKRKADARMTRILMI